MSRRPGTDPGHPPLVDDAGAGGSLPPSGLLAMLGGGVLVKTLIGIDYEVSVIAVGVLMLAYVLFGETLTLMQILGMAVCAGAVLIVTRKRPRAP